MEKKHPEQENAEQTQFKKFLDGLHVFHQSPKFPIRNWMAWLGVALFIVMVIVYYATNGG